MPTYRFMTDLCLSDLRRIVRKLNAQGVKVEFVKNRLTFPGSTDSTAQLMLTMLGAFAEFEVEPIRERRVKASRSPKQKACTRVSREISSRRKTVQRQQSAHAGVLCFSRQFRRDRRYFASVKAKIAECAVIELVKCVADGSRLSTLPVARMRSAGDCADCLDRRDLEFFPCLPPSIGCSE